MNGAIELHERILDALHNIGGVVTAEMLRDRASVAKPAHIIDFILSEMQSQGMVMQTGNGWIPAKPRGGFSKATTHGNTFGKTKSRRTTIEARDAVYEYLDAHPDAGPTEIAKEIKTGIGTASRFLKQYQAEQRVKAEEAEKRKDMHVDKDKEDAARKASEKLTGSPSMDENEKFDEGKVHAAIRRMQDKVTTTPVEHYDLKIDTLTALADLVEKSISEVLLQIVDDVKRLESLS